MIDPTALSWDSIVGGATICLGGALLFSCGLRLSSAFKYEARSAGFERRSEVSRTLLMFGTAVYLVGVVVVIS